jgi:hypothetical protein
MLPKNVLSSLQEWDPQHLEFPKMRKSTEEEIELCNLSQVWSLDQNSLYGDTVLGDFLPDYIQRAEDTVVFDNNAQCSRLISSLGHTELEPSSSFNELVDLRPTRTFLSKERKTLVEPKAFT